MVFSLALTIFKLNSTKQAKTVCVVITTVSVWREFFSVLKHRVLCYTQLVGYSLISSNRNRFWPLHIQISNKKYVHVNGSTVYRVHVKYSSFV